MTAYNYKSFSPDDHDFDNPHGPAIGTKAPDFEMVTPTGEKRRLLDFDGDFLVLEIGSITCPLFQSRRKIMSPLEAEFPGVTGTVLYVREAHPGDKIAAHESFDDKKACARKLIDDNGETRRVLVDEFDGTVHKAYGGLPNAVFIINKHHCVVYRSGWNNPSATRAALKALIAGRPVRAKSYFRPATPPVVIRTFTQAGKGSAADFFHGLPRLIWQNVVKRNLRLFFNRAPRASGNTMC